MNGYVGNLTIEQSRLLSEFKDRLADATLPDNSDYFYLRWLRARNFDLDKAEDMLRKNLIWRKKFGVDTILTDYKPPEVLEKYHPRCFLGADKEGSPLRYIPFKYLDLRGFALSLPKAEVSKYLTFLYEEETDFMKKQWDRINKIVENSTYIVDMDGYSFKQAMNMQAVDMLNYLLSVFEANYPERLKVTLFINVPVFFFMALALSKPFLAENTYKKFKFYGKDYQEALLEIIDADVLPAFLGGNRTDPDGNPNCSTLIHYGGFVPESYYFTNTGRKFCEEEGVESLLLDKRSSHFVDVEVTESGSKLLWEVETNDYDIGIGLYYKKKKDNDSDETELENIFPDDRVNSHLVPESCAYICDKAGTYSVKFNNDYSWFSQKKIFYKVKVVPPDVIVES